MQARSRDDWAPAVLIPQLVPGNPASIYFKKALVHFLPVRYPITLYQHAGVHSGKQQGVQRFICDPPRQNQSHVLQQKNSVFD